MINEKISVEKIILATVILAVLSLAVYFFIPKKPSPVVIQPTPTSIATSSLTPTPTPTKTIDKITFKNFSAYQKQDSNYNYMILAEGNKEIIVDQGDIKPNDSYSNLGKIRSFNSFKFSTDGDYLIYIISGYEWYEARLYDIKNKKIKMNFPSAEAYGFTPEGKYFYVWTANDFDAERYAKIYNVPDFTLRYDLFANGKNGKPFDFDGKYDETRRTLTFTFNNIDGSQGSVIEYFFDTNKATIK